MQARSKRPARVTNGFLVQLNVPAGQHCLKGWWSDILSWSLLLPIYLYLETIYQKDTLHCTKVHSGGIIYVNNWRRLDQKVQMICILYIGQSLGQCSSQGMQFSSSPPEVCDGRVFGSEVTWNHYVQEMKTTGKIITEKEGCILSSQRRVRCVKQPVLSTNCQVKVSNV